MRSGLVSLLTGESTISSVVGSRVYVGKAPQGAILPHIVLTQMDSNELPALDGHGSLRAVTCDIVCKAERSVTAESLAKIVRQYIDDYTGTAGSETIDAVIVNGETDAYEEPVDGSDIGIHAVTIDATIQYQES